MQERDLARFCSGARVRLCSVSFGFWLFARARAGFCEQWPHLSATRQKLRAVMRPFALFVLRSGPGASKKARYRIDLRDAEQDFE
jgi:hypothetical protein